MLLYVFQIKTDTDPVNVVGAIEPGSFQIPVTYLPSPEQINALTSQSEYCYQVTKFNVVHFHETIT